MHFGKRTFAVTALALAAGLCGSVFANDADNAANRGTENSLVANQFADQHPGVQYYSEGGRITTIYGVPFAIGATPVESAEASLANGLDVLGVTIDQLAPGSIAGDDAHVRQIMPQDDGSMRFTLVSYRQQVSNIPVYGADLLLLARNDAGYPLVFVRNNLRMIGDYVVDQNVAASPAVVGAYAAADEKLGAKGAMYTPASLEIWAGTYDAPTAPVLALVFEGTAGVSGKPDYQKVRFIADAATGAIVFSESMIHDVNVTGTVKGMATTGFKAAECNAEASTNLPYVKVTVGANSAYADVNGAFNVTNAGSVAVNAVAGPRGKYFRTLNPSADAPTTTQSITPGTPGTILFNSANTDQGRRAEVNAYLQSNVVRDMIMTALPTYPTIRNQFEGTGGSGPFTIKTGVAGTCNAFYDGSSINFYNSGGGCNNTAFYDVVHHEYGHHAVSTGGSGQGQYGEGMGDCMGVLLSDQPVLGYGFQSCASGIRNANNTKQYPQNGEIHDAGQLISGCLWSTRNAFVAAAVPNYSTALKRLTINANVLHRGTNITPQITIDWLTIDDVDGNILNGTPNYSLINTGFAAHNMPAPTLSYVTFTYPNGRPTTVQPFTPTSFPVVISPLGATPAPGTGFLSYRINAGVLTTIPMVQGVPNRYTVTLPALPCNATITYFVRARTTTNKTVVDPAGAPNITYSATVASPCLFVCPA
ncbi:MAG: hypothetical protein AABZ53_04520, partial [Planctomycetota bacterium]